MKKILLPCLICILGCVGVGYTLMYRSPYKPTEELDLTTLILFFVSGFALLAPFLGLLVYSVSFGYGWLLQRVRNQTRRWHLTGRQSMIQGVLLATLLTILGILQVFKLTTPINLVLLTLIFGLLETTSIWKR